MAGPQNDRRSTMSGPTTSWRRRAYEYELPREPPGQFTCICSAVPPPVVSPAVFKPICFLLILAPPPPGGPGGGSGVPFS